MALTFSQLFPPAIGLISRPNVFNSQPRHNVELHIVVSVCTDPVVDLARLFTQTAALLLPSSVSCILNSQQSIIETINLRCFQPAAILPDFSCTNFSYKSVEVITKNLSPNKFPVASFSPKNNYELHNKLINEMQFASFNPAQFFNSNNKIVSSQKEVEEIFDDFLKVVELAKQSVTKEQALLFSMKDISNPMCDIVLLLPNFNEITFFFIEIKDRIKSSFEGKLDGISKNFELLLAPVAEALRRVGIQFKHSIYLCCGY
jgi:hypothetical protein